MSIGYACVHIGSRKTKLYSLRLKNAIPDNLRLVTAKNLNALNAVIDYNIQSDIRLFRISSDIIPLGSHPVNTVAWQNDFASQLTQMGKQISENNLRVSMHPGQYTVINSLDPSVVSRAEEDLKYHCRFLDSLGCGPESKIILHIGGVYGDKPAAIARFVKNANALPNHIRSRLAIENDDRSYHISDVLSVSLKTGLPVVFDNLHHELNPPEEAGSMNDWILRCAATWRKQDGKQKIHYSQSASIGPRGAHSATISADTFLRFYQALPDKSIDIMLEVKDKNLSAVKCNLLTCPNTAIQDLEREWAKYKYWVLSRSAKIYQDIRALLKDKSHPDALAFYTLIERCAALPPNIGAEINAAQHVWGYLSDAAEPNEKKKFEKLLSGLAEKTFSVDSVKNFLLRMSEAQDQPYLLNSLYFFLP